MNPDLGIDLLGQARAMHAAGDVHRGMGVDEIDLEIGPGDDDHSFAHAAAQALAVVSPHEDHHHHLQHHQHQHQHQHQQQQDVMDPHHIVALQQLPPPPLLKEQPRKKKKVVKKWRDEWADTYKWAYLSVHEGTHRIFCSVCKEYGRKHRRNPYGNEGSRNMQMSALEEHNNSLLHKEALRLQLASRDKGVTLLERPIYFKALLSKSAESIIEAIIRRDPYEGEFIQAVQEVVHSLEPVLSKHPQYIHVLERMLEPERIIQFRVPWSDDKGETHISRGFRLQFNQALGHYKGGLCFHPSINLSTMKFLALEQTLKNALTILSIGGAKGGSDFDPRGKSDSEVLRFCQSFMEELYRYIGPNQDIPTGDMGVGSRELGYLFGHYRRFTNHFDVSFTGGSTCWTGSSSQISAVGYGLVHLASVILADSNKELRGLRCVVSGSGKVAMNALEKLLLFGAIPVTISDSKGYIYDEEGFDGMKFGLLKEIKGQQKSLREYTKKYPRARYCEDAKPWNEKCDIAFPCAIHNELNHADALALINGGCQIIVEGSDMPCTAQAVDVLRKAKIFVVPSKAANIGGVSIAGLDVAQSATPIQWSSDDLDFRLQEIAKTIYLRCMRAANEYGYAKGHPECLVHGANIASFLRVAQAMMEQGCI
ncbi:hypothetical protein O6H91_03G106300 [Diphasiastrum complanatum]|nr:hypothetical protein O6H91_03G106300 [Diphasiastrum complanatum]